MNCPVGHSDALQLISWRRRHASLSEKSWRSQFTGRQHQLIYQNDESKNKRICFLFLLLFFIGEKGLRYLKGKDAGIGRAVGGKGDEAQAGYAPIKRVANKALTVVRYLIRKDLARFVFSLNAVGADEGSR